MTPSFERWVKSKLGGRTSWFFSSKGGRSSRSFSCCGGNSPWQKSSRHSTVPASRRTALLWAHILPVCTRIAPCPAGAETVSVLARLSPRAGKDEHRRVETMRPLGFSRRRGRKTAPGTTPLGRSGDFPVPTLPFCFWRLIGGKRGGRGDSVPPRSPLSGAWKGAPPRRQECRRSWAPRMTPLRTPPLHVAAGHCRLRSEKGRGVG